ncbi:hypothetical protein BDF22DRAFT_652037 [Syncephalis plumigaleata]|nr:hypothetical protein BDF22DRAFT_652037 [Syncephalis plumigaleata]
MSLTSSTTADAIKVKREEHGAFNHANSTSNNGDSANEDVTANTDDNVDDEGVYEVEAIVGSRKRRRKQQEQQQQQQEQQATKKSKNDDNNDGNNDETEKDENNGQQTVHHASQVRERCPFKLLDFYEAHLRFTKIDVDAD